MILKKTSIFTKRLQKLDFKIKSVIMANLLKLEEGNFSNVKAVGAGVHELKINYQKGYRVYFTNVDGEIIILLCAGDKSSQQKDIEKAKKIKEIGGY
ncbi:MAG: type II toxin-antitoxin system RelE/ParE family toxin [Endomicrobium sp.]|nr:type II toxin-antitoxin system RelE/ParE family toxin [Endomicrobium sp.]